MVIVVALVGVAGVIVGALLSGLVTIHLERLRDGRAALVAARLISDDLEYVGTWLSTGNEFQQIISFEQAVSLSMDDWREQRSLLAGHLSIDEWNDVAFAARQADAYIRFAAQVSKETEGAGRELLLHEHKRLLDDEAFIAKGIRALQPLANGSRLPRTWVPGFSWPVPAALRR